MRIQASPTWFCQLYDQRKAAPAGKNCAYCQIYSPARTPYVQLGSKRIVLGHEMTPQQWLRGFHRIRPNAPSRIEFDFTGGEPTLYDGLVPLLEGIRSFADWSVTSNTLLRKRIEEIFVANIDPPKSWTSSWHPAAGKDIEEFIKTLEFIRSHGVYCSTTIVLHETTAKTIKTDLQRINEAGFVVQIHAALMEGYSVAEDTAEVRALYDELKWLNRAPTESWNETPPELGTVRDCVAGMESISVSSDGMIYACYQHLFCQDAPPIGKWGEWIPATEPTRGCSWPCTFACDIKNVIGAPPKLWMGAAAQ